MTNFLAFTIVGIVSGAIYAITATGLVVTYTTSGIFNLAHGAIGMLAAFTYWELRVHHHWPTLLALFVVLFVLAPLFGALVERVIMRRLHGAPTSVSLVVTMGLLLALIGLASTIWDPTTLTRRLPPFFGTSHVKVFSVNVTFHQITVIAVVALVALALRLFLTRTQLGIAMRAVVDDPDLAAMTGASPVRMAQLSWALGAMLAALAGILLAPLVSLDIIILTLLVINGYAAAMVGRLRSLPLTFAGGVALGLVESYAVGYVPGNILSHTRTTLPIFFLYAVLLILPSARLRTARPVSARVTKTPSLRTSVVAGAALVALVAVVSPHLSVSNLLTEGQGLALALIMLSLVLLTGYGGQISLCQLTFVGMGAFAVGKVGATPLGILAGVGLAAGVGIVAALPSLRLQGLYLALATLAFAQAMTKVFFENNAIFGYGGHLAVDRPNLLGIHFQSDRAFVTLLAVVFALAAVGVLAVRRSGFGRRLTAMGDSPAACATLGMGVTWTKVVVFAAAGGLAGLGGALYGGLRTSVGAQDFEMLASLTLLLLLTIWGNSSVLAALLAGVSYAIFPVIQQHLPDVRQLAYLGAGLGALSLGRNPAGVIGDIAARFEKLRRSWRSEPAAAEPVDGLEPAVAA
jgi:branched-chain amino acid transport system permease protein